MTQIVPPSSRPNCIGDPGLEPVYCGFCRHYIRAERRCNAFPNGIPKVIYEGLADHRRPFEGDSGIQFEAAHEGDEEFVEMALEINGQDSLWSRIVRIWRFRKKKT